MAKSKQYHKLLDKRANAVRALQHHESMFQNLSATMSYAKTVLPLVESSYQKYQKVTDTLEDHDEFDYSDLNPRDEIILQTYIDLATNLKCIINSENQDRRNELERKTILRLPNESIHISMPVYQIDEISISSLPKIAIEKCDENQEIRQKCDTDILCCSENDQMNSSMVSVFNVEKMNCQIAIAPEDQKYDQILCQFSNNESIETHQQIKEENCVIESSFDSVTCESYDPVNSSTIEAKLKSICLKTNIGSIESSHTLRFNCNWIESMRRTSRKCTMKKCPNLSWNKSAIVIIWLQATWLPNVENGVNTIQKLSSAKSQPKKKDQKQHMALYRRRKHQFFSDEICPITKLYKVPPARENVPAEQQ